MKDTKDPSLLYLSRADVEAAGLDMPTVIALLETAFLEKGEGRVEMPPKPGIHPGPDAFIHAMPALIPKMRAAGIKWVGGFPENPSRGLPYISGLIILNDVETGLPTAIMDCTWITGYRTAGATAVAARRLARPDSETAGILGCGLQGRTHLLALASIFPLKKVLAYDISSAALKAFIEEMSPKLGLRIDPVSEPRRAVEASDLVITAGPLLKNPDPVIEKDWLQPGAFAGAVDFDSYWMPEALLQMDKLVTDDIPQFQYYRTVGYFRQTPDPTADLGEILAGHKPGRENASERTMAMNLGLAIGDMAVAPEVFRRAAERGLGVRLPL
jgi:ornithine cyclodeaminase/alanine dehydrogenase-like protein (mu-crystallin family)